MSPTKTWASHTEDNRQKRDLQNSQNYLELVQPEAWKPGNAVSQPFEQQSSKTLYMPGEEPREKPETAATATGIGSEKVKTDSI